MLDINDDAYKDDIDFENYEISPILCESFQRQRPPFLPIPGGNVPPIDNYPPDFNVNSPPGFNYPGGALTHLECLNLHLQIIFPAKILLEFKILIQVKVV